MGRRGNGYGSEDNLIKYVTEKPDLLTAALRQAGHCSQITWLYPQNITTEPLDLRFIHMTASQANAWQRFWPQPGNRRWDAVARTDEKEWLLFEAKANASELRSPACAASGRSHQQIKRALLEVKKYLGVEETTVWDSRFYQYANRLAALYFLNVIAGIPSRLVFVYFIGDRFPDGRQCPDSESTWQCRIEQCHRALQLPAQHKLRDRIHEVFLPAFSTLK